MYFICMPFRFALILTSFASLQSGKSYVRGMQYKKPENPMKMIPLIKNINIYIYIMFKILFYWKFKGFIGSVLIFA